MPTRDRPTHASSAVEWIFKHVLEKKFVCDISEQKNEKCYVFLLERKNNLIRKKNQAPPSPCYEMVRP